MDTRVLFIVAAMIETRIVSYPSVEVHSNEALLAMSSSSLRKILEMVKQIVNKVDRLDVEVAIIRHSTLNRAESSQRRTARYEMENRRR